MGTFETTGSEKFSTHNDKEDLESVKRVVRVTYEVDR
ncbi:hypothetical protein PPL_04949 [Heterostelium album PN500]|uniref:Uncharacterized protein n=1 Tax=Heterostelium pallidum (strain ATCC 26659 / Pp 5 / PN500) TaxID=670386 RepID=D3B905_HETP5|nr:hypothetical protein PPL_04949 [Heterostelium album PN500]EFA82044.1 hypothetical protein PPL_04949 [Heterostelium album PN500]|eukprot:XP_020434161.1 hypothetical protein PPL_04949 [Heterostelium album PN500]